MDEKFIKNFINGGIAGIVSRTITSPFERLKILRQNFPLQYNNYNLFSSFKYMYLNEGPKSLFKGNLTNCVRIFPQTAIQYSVFEYSKHKFNYFDKKFNYFLAGGLAGITSYTAIYPLETVRSKLSAQTNEKIYKGIVDCLYKSTKQNGFQSLYKGCSISAIGMIPFQGSNFLTYNYLNDLYNPYGSKIKSLIFGSCAGIVAVSLTFPFDTIKRKLQLSGELGNPVYKNTSHCIKYTVQKYGIKGLYRGLIPCYLKRFPANGLYFMIIEILKDFY